MKSRNIVDSGLFPGLVIPVYPDFFPKLAAPINALAECDMALKFLETSQTVFLDIAFALCTGTSSELGSYVIQCLTQFRNDFGLEGHLVLRSLVAQYKSKEFAECLRLNMSYGMDEYEVASHIQKHLQFEWMEIIKEMIREQIEAQATQEQNSLPTTTEFEKPFSGAKAQLHLALESMAANYDVTDPDVVERSIQLLDRADIALSNVMYGTKLIKLQPSEVQIIAAVRVILQTKAAQVRVFRSRFLTVTDKKVR